MTRAEMEAKIKSAEAELQTAGKIHARDLKKHIRRLRREVRDYDRYQSAARRPA